MSKLNYMLESRASQHYQPIVDMNTLELVRYEALIRPIGFSKDTGSIVRQIESSGNIRELDLWSISKAIEKIEREGRKIEIAVNLSAKSLCDPVFCNEVEWILDKKKNNTNIGFEITETEPISDIKMARKFIEMIRSKGCSIGLDDFGVGISTFSVAESLLLDYIKISSRLTTAVLSNHKARSIVDRLVNNASIMDISLVAEHIDNLDQFRWLKDIGIQDGQGWLFSAAKKDIKDSHVFSIEGDSKKSGVTSIGKIMSKKKYEKEIFSLTS